MRKKIIFGAVLLLPLSMITACTNKTKGVDYKKDLSIGEELSDKEKADVIWAAYQKLDEVVKFTVSTKSFEATDKNANSTTETKQVTHNYANYYSHSDSETKTTYVTNGVTTVVEGETTEDSWVDGEKKQYLEVINDKHNKEIKVRGHFFDTDEQGQFELLKTDFYRAIGGMFLSQMTDANAYKSGDNYNFVMRYYDESELPMVFGEDVLTGKSSTKRQMTMTINKSFKVTEFSYDYLKEANYTQTIPPLGEEMIKLQENHNEVKFEYGKLKDNSKELAKINAEYNSVQIVDLSLNTTLGIYNAEAQTYNGKSSPDYDIEMKFITFAKRHVDAVIPLNNSDQANAFSLRLAGHTHDHIIPSDEWVGLIDKEFEGLQAKLPSGYSVNNNVDHDVVYYLPEGQMIEGYLHLSFDVEITQTELVISNLDAFISQVM